jgi:hypothetical protein
VRRVLFNPSALSAADFSRWNDWTTRAERQAAQLLAKVEAGETPNPEVLSPLWREAKKLLLEFAYSFKCGYCEFELRGGAFGPADHYRPKSRISVLGDDGTRTVVKGMNGEARPGYWWLAVAWDNLVPACDFCNNQKSDLFPIEASWASGPNDGTTHEQLDALERPLLLHPLYDDPAEHLVFTTLGSVAARSDSRRGTTTIDICALNRDGLSDARRRQQRQARQALLLAAGARQDAESKCAQVYRDYTAPDAPFSAAVKDYLDALLASDLLAPSSQVERD